MLLKITFKSGYILVISYNISIRGYIGASPRSTFLIRVFFGKLLNKKINDTQANTIIPNTYISAITKIKNNISNGNIYSIRYPGAD